MKNDPKNDAEDLTGTPLEFQEPNTSHTDHIDLCTGDDGSCPTWCGSSMQW